MGYSDTYTKGVGFEKFTAELFMRAGFIVERNVVLSGRSGVKHQVDLLAVYKTPIMDLRILVECKNWDKPVNKDVVMKVYNKVQDLGLNKGVIVTKSYATPDAVVYARSVGIEIIDNVRLNELVSLLGVSMEEVGGAYYFPVDVKCSQKVVKGELTQHDIYYYPLYMLKLRVSRAEKKGFIRVEEYVVEEEYLVFIDAIRGHSATLTDKQILFEKQVPVKLGDEELEVYKRISEASNATIDQIAGYFGISRAKARKILEGLVSKNLVESEERGRKKYYRPAFPLTLHDVKETGVKLLEYKPVEGVELKPRLQVSDVIRTVEFIVKTVRNITHSKVEEYKLVYYPIAVVTQDGRKMLVDMHVCDQMKQVEKIAEDILKQQY